ncbi:hypothetical protein COU59_01880 [Candidatus Pacearchaeota archaeon CG10_big_fil_rev_8_21_14_0_10_34_12]|nr:MAG: hypothetical protein COU59_01880 [Candidatus Pacearchaeota archaeon CG10_big_fil_rev_8_21_14_0_10_34_12]
MSQIGYFKDIFRRIIRRDFSGNTGIAIQNSFFQFLTSLTAKGGSLLFTIIIARLLMPELFGLYSLALSTILIFSTFSELGLGPTLVRFLSKELGKNIKSKKAKSYIAYLGKLRFLLLFSSILILLISSKFIAQIYYQKPIFLALIAGALYILVVGVVSFLESILHALNSFKNIFYKEVVFQSTRLVIIPLIVLFLLKKSTSNEFILFYMVLGLSISYIFSSIILLVSSNKKLSHLPLEKIKISFLEKKRINRFIFPISAIVITTTFYGSIDMVMLGRFVSPEYIGYYRAAISLIAALTSLTTFSVVLLPIFSRMKGKQLERGFTKSISVVFPVSIVLSLFIILFSKIIIHIIFGGDYAQSVTLLRFFSLMIISISIISIYVSYFTAKGKLLIIARLLVFSIFINIVLNLLAIFLLRDYGNLFVVYGVTGATIASSWLYMTGLILSKRRRKIRH